MANEKLRLGCPTKNVAILVGTVAGRGVDPMYIEIIGENILHLDFLVFVVVWLFERLFLCVKRITKRYANEEFMKLAWLMKKLF